MSMVSDQQEFERLKRLAPTEAHTLTAFHVWITADRMVERDELTALLSQRFPRFTVSVGTMHSVVDRL